jgi:hypothetical protein
MNQLALANVVLLGAVAAVAAVEALANVVLLGAVAAVAAN